MPLLLTRILILAYMCIGVVLGLFAWFGARNFPYADTHSDNTYIRRVQAGLRLGPWYERLKRFGLELGLFIVFVYLWPYGLYVGIQRARGVRFRQQQAGDHAARAMHRDPEVS